MTYKFNEAQLKWLEALESGEYEQARGMLKNGNGYCCLGLACIAAGEKFEGYRCLGSAVKAPQVVVGALRLRGNDGDIEASMTLKGKPTLAIANDNGATFSEIAAFIRSNPTAVFKD